MKSKKDFLDVNGLDFEAFEFENEYSAKNILKTMDEYAKQEAIAFLKWYIDKAVVFVHYLSEIKPLVKSYEIEEKLMEFEGTTFEGLYNLYLKSK